jgi:4-diphosphocytidyl-2-C-methyl-D-erythritol kinase
MAVLSERPLEEWDKLLPNTLEPYVLRTYPAVGRVKQILLDGGAAYCAMSGSGSTVFAFFRSQPPTFAWPPDHSHWEFTL